VSSEPVLYRVAALHSQCLRWGRKRRSALMLACQLRSAADNAVCQVMGEMCQQWTHAVQQIVIRRGTDCQLSSRGKKPRYLRSGPFWDREVRCSNYAGCRGFSRNRASFITTGDPILSKYDHTRHRRTRRRRTVDRHSHKHRVGNNRRRLVQALVLKLVERRVQRFSVG
jgi:hypothetical protein